MMFEMHLKYKSDTLPVHESGKVGKYIGSGEGDVRGERLRGRVHWTLFEDVSETLCQSNLFGVITTDDRAEIRFDSLGFFYVPDQEKPQKWETSAAVHFATSDERYAWLDGKLGTWQGTFDMDVYQHHYKVFVADNQKT
jgi:hypothetical protein